MRNYMVGLRLHYPKWAEYRQGDGYAPPVRTTDLGSYQDYVTLKKRIQAITKPLRVELEGREVRTKIRVGPAMLERLERFHFFRENPVTVVG